MSLFSHQLSDETMELIEAAVREGDVRLSIYAPHNWAVENHSGRGALAFDPSCDSDYLREELRRISKRGHV